jgi:autoinducer 2-degrading protein
MTRFSLKLLFVLAPTLAVLHLPGVAVGEEKEHPIVAQIKPHLKDPSKPFTMIVKLQIKEGMNDKFEAAFAPAIKGTRKEKGYIAYDLNRDAKDPTRYMVYERWQNLPALDAHLKTAHITKLLDELKDVLAGPPDAQVMLVVSE